MKRNLLIIPSAILLVLFMSHASLAAGSDPAFGGDIKVDGMTADWDLATDHFADMFRPGEQGTVGNLLSSLYLRYNCHENMLYALVLDESGDAMLVDEKPLDAWIRIYADGIPGETLIDGTGNGGTKVHAFSWVQKTPEDPRSQVIGFEASAYLGEGSYEKFEASVSIGGSAATTGDYADGNTIPLVLRCKPDKPGKKEGHNLLSGRVLEQNHPNPFNPVTTIRFDLGQAGPARLTVVDLLGRQVAVLADGLLEAGEHAYSFNATNLASGVYIYRLETQESTLSRRMILTK
jgi:hypothetical protein